MNVLFFCREKSNGEISPIIKLQAESLMESASISILLIKGKGWWNYFRGMTLLRKYLKRNSIDLIHAHYSISGFVASLSFSRVPVICSLMGSDLLEKSITRPFIPFFHRFFWRKTIVKSPEMKQRLPGTYLIPNGVDTENFKPIEKRKSLSKTGFSVKEKNILFVALAAKMPVKNLDLAKKAVHELQNKYYPEAKLHVLENVPFAELPYYYNAADVLLLTSKTEGSPNVVKEALACNCKVVSTDVGDVKQILENINGSYLCSFDPLDICEKIKCALDYDGKIDSRVHIAELDSKVITQKIIRLYREALNK